MVTQPVSPSSAAADEDEPAFSGSGYVGRIPVRNLWLLMFYASELFRERGIGNTALDDNPDDLPDLIAEILAHAVEQRQRRHLSVGYRSRHDVIHRVRGRIDVLTTECRQLLSHGRVACRFEELSIDTPRNRFVRAALDRISRLVTDEDAARRCRTLANAMKALGVGGVPPTLAAMTADRFGRHDADDRLMVAAANLAFDLAIPNEQTGKSVLPLPERDERWVRKLFERAIGGFYEVGAEPARLANAQGPYSSLADRAQDVRYRKDTAEHADGHRPGAWGSVAEDRDRHEVQLDPDEWLVSRRVAP